MTTISATLAIVQRRIAEAALQAHRPVSEIGLIAVSKRHSPARIREAYACGQRLFGESYAQEGLEKIQALADLALEWHFIGPIQSNKTRLIAENFDWVHSVDRLKIAQRLSDARAENVVRPPLQVCLQVNLSGEESKQGVSVETVSELARAVSRLPGLKLRGLMCIPEPTQDFALQRSRFAALKDCLQNLQAEGLAVDTLSMGMSDDLEAAILEGATLVRIGTAIFGERQ